MPDTLAQVLAAARKELIAADIDGSALDARLLMQAASGLSHEEMIASDGMVLDAATHQRFRLFLQRRLGHEPVSRILGAREFYGRSFQVTSAVLDPRPDTEALVDLILARNDDGPRRVVDIGTGSGAILITLLAERPKFSGVAVDISADALHVAKVNGLANGVSGRLHLHEGSWFGGLQEQFDLIVSNPPYIPHRDIAGLAADVRDFDPHLALDGGADGLFAYRALANDARKFLMPQGEISVEIGAGQQEDVERIFAAKGFTLLANRQDLGGHVRALVFG